MADRVRSRPRRIVRALLATTLGLLLAPLVAEICVRWLIFSPDPVARHFGASLQKPDASSHPDNDEHWWYLQRRFAEPGALSSPTVADPVLGWGGEIIDPATGQHFDAAHRRGRRPVLLYGDSFAACVTEESKAFQGLMESSDLADRFQLINYGIAGFGLDQACLMLERTIEHHVDQKPIVIFSMLVESDLDRSGLGFRSWPKPKFDVVDGRLSGPDPFELDPDRWFDENLSRLHSYALGVATYRTGVIPAGLRERLYSRDARIPEKKEINRLILERVHALLEHLGVEHFVLLFHCRGTLPNEPWYTWQEPLVTKTCARIGMTCVDTRPFLRMAASGDWDTASAFYIHGGPVDGHLDEVGNQIAFESMREGILGAEGPPHLSRLRQLLVDGVIARVAPEPRSRPLFGREAWVHSNQGGGCLRFGRQFSPLVDTGGLDTLLMRGGPEVPCEFSVPPDGKRHVLVGELRYAVRPGVDCTPGTVRFTVRNGATVVATYELTPDWAPRKIELEVGPDAELSVSAESVGPDVECAWACLVGARID